MKITRYIFLISQVLFFTACAKKEPLPERKVGDTCSVTFIGNEGVTCECPTSVPIDQELNLHFDIKYIDCPDDTVWAEKPTIGDDGTLETPNIEYVVNVGDIEIYIGGKKYDNSFIYYAETSGNNTLTIKHEYVVNDIEIHVNARARPRLFMFGFNFGESIESRRIKTGSEYRDSQDIEVNFKTNYQNKIYPIHTLTGGKGFPVFEDDDVDITLKAISNDPLPNNIWLRINSRYAMKEIDFTCEYINDKTCNFHIPHFIVRDHGTIVQYGEK
ncbi:MAG: hypothetical protein MJ208_03035 [Bacilli bacterium]|nr:hypothetical protein [Bacilli bacterium]